MLRRSLLALTMLLGIDGCFDEPGDAQTGPGSSTDAPATSTSDPDPTLTSTDPSTTLLSTSSGDTSSGFADSTSSGCLPSERGCACSSAPDACEPGTTCVDGTCVESPAAECVVSYGGTGGAISFAVTSVLQDGSLSVDSEQVFAGQHETPGDVAGQDMLVRCGGTLYAVLDEEPAVLALRMEPDRTLTEIDRFPIPTLRAGSYQLRALECPDPTDDFLLAVALLEPAESPGVAIVQLHAFERSPSGTLEFNSEPIDFPVSTSGTPRRVRTAWSAVLERGYVIYDNPEPNGSTLESYALQPRTGIVSLGPPTPSFVNGIQARLGALEVSPDGAFLGLVGAQVGDPTGAGAAVRFDLANDGVPMQTFELLADQDGDAFLQTARSLVFGPLDGGGPTALVGSEGRFGVVGFPATPMTIPATFSSDGRGLSHVLRAHDGGVVVVADPGSVRSYDGSAMLDQLGQQPLEVAPRPLPSYSDSIVVPCPG